MCKRLPVLLSVLLFAYVVARPVDEQDNTAAATTSTTQATIIKQDSVNNADGSFNSTYETSNGIKVENVGYLKKITIPPSESVDGKIMEAREELVLVHTGSYSYIDPEGNVITLRYIADENGFQPQGDHLPLPPQ